MPVAQATYVYGLLASARLPALGRGPRGLPGMGSPRLLPAGGSLWLVVADAPLPRYDARRIEQGLRDLDWVSACAVGHAAVVEHAGRLGPVIPMKLFTLFTTDDRAVRHVATRRRRLERLCARIAGSHEWGVRIGVGKGGLRPAAGRGAPAAARGAGAGTRFLLRKGAEVMATRRLAADTRTEVARVFRRLERLARASQRRPVLADGSGGMTLLDAAYLVPDRRRARFRAAVAAAAKELRRHGCLVSLTGPWPAYSFVGDRA
jgi:gas vesicle protein GvpL/GvpF